MRLVVVDNEGRLKEPLHATSLLVDGDATISRAAGNAVLTVESAATTDARLYLKGNRTADGTLGSIIAFNAADSMAYIYFLRQDADDSGEIAFGTQNAGSVGERVRIDKVGNVGIGKTPGSKLDIDLATEDLEIVNAGSTDATEQDWIEVEVGGNVGYIRVYAAK